VILVDSIRHFSTQFRLYIVEARRKNAHGLHQMALGAIKGTVRSQCLGRTTASELVMGRASDVPSRVETWRDEPSGIKVITYIWASNDTGDGKLMCRNNCKWDVWGRQRIHQGSGVLLPLPLVQCSYVPAKKSNPRVIHLKPS